MFEWLEILRLSRHHACVFRKKEDFTIAQTETNSYFRAKSCKKQDKVLQNDSMQATKKKVLFIN